MHYSVTDAVDLFSVELAESGPTRLHAMPVNKRFKHSRYGTIEFTPERIQRFADNVNNNVRGIPLDIDYDHKQSAAHGTKAAGWVTGAEATDNGLIYSVEFTEDAREAIKKKEYRFFSPEFADEWTDPHSGKKYQDVAFGGGITNRPFLRDHITPLALSEAEDIQSPSLKDKTMGWLEDAIARAFNLTEQSSVEDIRAALGDTVTDPAPPPPTPTPNPTPAPTPPTPDPTPPTPAPTTNLSELPEFRQLAQQNAAMAQQLKEMNVERKLNNFVNGGYALSAPAREAAKKLLMNISADDETTLNEFLAELGKTGLVQLGEQGTGNPDGGDRSLTDPMDEVDRQVNALLAGELKDMNATDPYGAYTEASRRVFADEKLHLAYRNASFLEGEVKN